MDAGETILGGDFLGPQVLLDRHREVGAALHGRIVGDHHDLPAVHAPDAGDHAGAWRRPVVHRVCGERADLEKRSGGIEQTLDALANRKLPLAPLSLLCPRPAAGSRDLETALQLGFERRHALLVRAEPVGAWIDVAFENTQLGGTSAARVCQKRSGRRGGCRTAEGR